MRVALAAVAALAVLLLAACGGDGDGSSSTSVDRRDLVPPTVLQGLGELVEICALMEQQALVLQADFDEGLVDNAEKQAAFDGARAKYVEAKAGFDAWMVELKRVVSGFTFHIPLTMLEGVTAGADAFIDDATAAHSTISGEPAPAGTEMGPLATRLTSLKEAATLVWNAYKGEGRDAQEAIKEEFDRVRCPAWPGSSS